MVIPLSNIDEGKTARINCIGCDAAIKKRLSSLGLYDGKNLKVVKNDRKGPLIVKVLDSKIVIGRIQADDIKVEESDEK